MVSSSRGVRGAGGVGVGADGDDRVCFPLVELQSFWELGTGTCFADRAWAVGTIIGREDWVEADDEEKGDDADVVEALFEQSKL